LDQSSTLADTTPIAALMIPAKAPPGLDTGLGGWGVPVVAVMWSSFL
jgi:hypothetical protein